MTVTLKDIAQKVDRSVTTVSRALHGYSDVSAETSVLVRRTAEEMGYFPNVAAQRLQKRKADTVGLILSHHEPRLSDPAFGDVLAGVADEIATDGFDLLISVAAQGADAFESYRRKVNSRRIDCVLVVRTLGHDPRIDYLLEHNIPFVANGRVLGACSFPYVDVDYSGGVRKLVRHLRDLGHERIGFVGGSPEFTFVHLQLKGFRQGLEDCGLAVVEDLIVNVDVTQKGGYQGAQNLLSWNEPPSAIIASNDLMALGALSAVQDHGLDVGRDVAVAGFDDIPMAETSHPTLTTLHQPAEHIGRLLGKMLMAQANGQTIDEPQVVVEPSLVIRQSTSLDLWL